MGTSIAPCPQQIDNKGKAMMDERAEYPPRGLQPLVICFIGGTAAFLALGLLGSIFLLPPDTGMAFFVGITLLFASAWIDYKVIKGINIPLRGLAYICALLSGLAAVFVWWLAVGRYVPDSEDLSLPGTSIRLSFHVLAPLAFLTPLLAPLLSFLLNVFSPHPMGFLSKFAPTIFCILSLGMFVVGFYGNE